MIGDSWWCIQPLINKSEILQCPFILHFLNSNIHHALGSEGSVCKLAFYSHWGVTEFETYFQIRYLQGVRVEREETPEV